MNSMPQKGIITGAILIILGISGYLIGERVSVTALIPTFFGIPLLLVSLLGRKPQHLKLGMHLAAVIALLGFLTPLGRILPQMAKGEFQIELATISMLAMVMICGLFTLSCIRSFRAARKAKKED